MARLAFDSRLMIVLLAAAASINPFATDMYLPSMPAIRASLGASTAQVQATLSLFFLGAVAGQLVIGPMSDHWGRRPFIIGCLGLFAAASIACCLAPSIEILIMARVVQAIGAAGATTLSRAVVRDVHEGWNASRQFARINSLRGLVPLLGPLLGAAVATAFSWRAVFVVMALGGSLICGLIWRYLPETLAKPEGRLSFATVRIDYADILRNATFRFYAAINALLFVGFFGFLSGSSFVLQGNYGLTQGQYAVAFSLTVLGYICGSLLAQRLPGILSPTALIRLGILVSLTGALGTTAAMGLQIGGVPLIIFASALYVVGMALAMPFCEAGALAPFPGKVGSAASLHSILNMTFGALAGLLLSRLFDVSILALPAMEILGTSAALVLIVFFRPDRPND